MNATITVNLDTLTAEVTAGTLDAEGLRRLEQEAAVAVSAIRREVKRRNDYERREEHVAMFRRLRGDTVREVTLPGDPPRPVLVGLYRSSYDEVWPVAIDPSTGQDVRVSWRDLDPSPWGSMWLTRTPRGHTAHRWDGGASCACGQGAGMPLPWDRRRSVYVARSAARPCQKCARTLTPDFHPRPEAVAPGYVGEKKEAP